MAALSAGARLRALMKSGPAVPAPGAFSPIIARLVEEAGFPAVYLTGSGISAAAIGAPDVGLLTLSELAEVARRTAAATDICVVCDADDGFGGVLNVRRTVRELEAAGVAALHLEDQAFPKKCGFFEGHRLLPPAEMVQRLKAALDARRDPSTVIIARTEVMGARSIEESIERGCAYGEAGADLVFVNGVTTTEQVERLVKAIPFPQVYNVSSSGRTPHLTVERIGALGYRLVIYPVHTLFLSVRLIQDMLADLKRTGTVEAWLPRMIDFAEWRRLTGALAAEEVERRYTEADAGAGPAGSG